MKILATGGAGYIGSHTTVELIDAGHDVVIVDFAPKASKAVARMEQITGKQIKLYTFDIRDQIKLKQLFEDESIDAVVHLAGFKAVGESTEKPMLYYRNNIESTLVLCEVMAEMNVKKLIFSSSATVYGKPERLPLSEESPTPAKATNPYGQTKLMIEHILADIAASDHGWQISVLRYFNPVGAHESGLIGEDPEGLPNNLTPYLLKVAVGELKEAMVHGDDWPTPDGTGVRDYIHIVDLARGHVAALEHLPNSGVATYNLGTGKGSSVKEVIAAIEKASGRPVPYKVGPRRPGDIAECYCDPQKAKDQLDWEAKFDLNRMCVDGWNWQQKNPKGYS